MSSLSCFFLTKPSVANATIGRADTGQAEWLQMTHRISKSLNSLSRCRGMRDHRYHQLINKISTQTNELLAHLASSGSERLSDDGGQGEAQSIPPHVMDTLYRVMYHTRSESLLKSCIAFFLNIAKQGTEQSQVAVGYLVGFRRQLHMYFYFTNLFYDLFKTECLDAVKAHDDTLQGEQQLAWRKMWFSAAHPCRDHREMLQSWCAEPTTQGRESMAMWQAHLWRRQLTHASLVADAYQHKELNEWMGAMVTHVSQLDDEPIRSSLIRETVDHIATMAHGQQSDGHYAFSFLIDFTTKMMNEPSVSIETKQYIATQCMSLIAASSPPSDQAGRLLVNRFFVSCDVIVPHPFVGCLASPNADQWRQFACLQMMASRYYSDGKTYNVNHCQWIVQMLSNDDVPFSSQQHMVTQLTKKMSDCAQNFLSITYPIDQENAWWYFCQVFQEGRSHHAVAALNQCLLEDEGNHLRHFISMIHRIRDPQHYSRFRGQQILLANNQSLDRFRPHLWRAWRTLLSYPDLHRPTLHELTRSDQSLESLFGIAPLFGIAALVKGPVSISDKALACRCIDRVVQLDDNNRLTADCESNINATLDALFPTPFQDQTETTLKKTIDLLVIMKNTMPEGVSQHKVRALLQLLSKRYPALSQLCLISDQLSPHELTALVVDLLTTYQKPNPKMPPVAGHQPIGHTTMPHLFEG